MPALLCAAVVSIVLGIIGMHALTIHGAMMSNSEHATMAGSAAGMMTGPMADHADESAGVTTSDETTTAEAPDGGGGHDMGDMVMLCVAMLAAAAGALLLLTSGLRRNPRAWAHLPTVPGAITGWVTARRGTGPPPVWEFSVIRC